MLYLMVCHAVQLENKNTFDVNKTWFVVYYSN